MVSERSFAAVGAMIIWCAPSVARRMCEPAVLPSALNGPEQVCTMVVPVSSQDLPYALQVVRELRAGGQMAELDVSGHGVGTGLKLAARKGMRWAAIVGEDEERAGSITWHDLQRGEERRVPLAQLLQREE